MTVLPQSYVDLLMAVPRIWRRVQTLISRGRIYAPANDSGNVQMLQITLNDLEIRDNTPRLAEYGFTSVPLPPDWPPGQPKPGYGCDALVLFVSGDRSNGVIIATGDQRYRLKNLAPGEVALYDDQGQIVHLSRDRIHLSSPKEVRIEGPKVKVHATAELALDCQGNGVIWTPSVIQTYQDGVATSHSAPTPPEVPS